MTAQPTRLDTDPAARVTTIFLFEGFRDYCARHGQPLVSGRAGGPVHDPDAITGRVGGALEQAQLISGLGGHVQAETCRWLNRHTNPDDQHPGVLAYEVHNPLGWWIADQIAGGDLPVGQLWPVGEQQPLPAAVRARLHTLLEEFFTGWVGPVDQSQHLDLTDLSSGARR